MADGSLTTARVITNCPLCGFRQRKGLVVKGQDTVVYAGDGGELNYTENAEC